MFCTNCGQDLDQALVNGDKYCPRCGTSISLIADSGGSAASPPVEGCELCQRDLPTKRFEFHGIWCFLIFFRWKDWSAVLCRSCAGRLHSRVQWETLSTGIWGIPGVVISPLFMILNLIEYTYGALKLPRS